MEDMGILEVEVWAKASDRFAKHDETWRVCSHCYLIGDPRPDHREQDRAHRSTLQAPSSPTGRDPPRTW